MLRLLILVVLFTNIVAIYQDYKPVRRSGTSGTMCPIGQAIHVVFPNHDYICKPAPGGRKLACKDYVLDTELPFRCPRNGYVRGFSQVDGQLNRIRCCTKPGLFYSEENCAIHFNSDTANGQIHTIYRGKFVTGFFSNDGRKTFTSAECGYKECGYNCYNLRGC